MAIVVKDKVKIKDKRVQVYYDVVDKQGKTSEIRKRYWLHEKGKKLYAYVRDYKQAVNVSSDTVSLDVDVIFILNTNKRVIEHYNKPIIIVFNNVHYKSVAKPDEYEYYKSDIKVMAKRCTEVKEADYEYYIDNISIPSGNIAMRGGYLVINKDNGLIQVGG